MRLVAATLLLIALSLPVQAAHPGCTTSEATRIPATGTAGGSVFYLTSQCHDGCTAGVWVYQESNGEPGLQRDDSGRDDTMDGSCYKPDTRIV